MFIVLFGIFAYTMLTLPFLTLQMTLSHENITKNRLPNQNHMKMRYDSLVPDHIC